VKQFVADETGGKADHLKLTTRLLHDLGVDGDDGPEYMQAFAECFDVNLSQFEANRHFGPEAGCNPIFYVYSVLFARDRPKRVPITIRDLVEAARRRKWSPPDHPPA
jgi:hypothetical protein